jgi:uncharacterized coiled-coil protein SlyX
MSELAIDTHRFIKKLMENGFTEAQAETLADTQMAFLESRLATKDELLATKNELSAEIAAVHARIDKLEAHVDSRIDKLEANMNARFAAQESQFRVMLLRSQIATGAAIITILTFIDYITP